MPLKVAFKRFFGRGATYPIPCEVAYSDFRVVSGVAYPFHIEHILNGTAWATIVVNSVVVNAPVAADAFIVQ
jgi:hypothetical protein